MEFNKVHEYLIARLNNELPGHLTYHNVQHTEEVLSAVEYLAGAENITGEDLLLLKTAALFHDAGFLEGEKEHEQKSCKLAKEILPSFGYSPAQVDKVCRVIMVTRLPQKPTNSLEEIICDADLFYLGSDNYFDRAEKLHTEFKTNGSVKEDRDWIKLQIDFLKKHRYFTVTALKEREPKKNENIHELFIRQELQKAIHKNKNPALRNIKDLLLTITGVLFAGFALRGFLVPNHFFDGGVTGVSLLIHEYFHYNIGYVIVLANVPLIVLGWKTISRRFAIKTFVSVMLLGVCLLFIPYPVITSDKLLISIFGGVFLGIGIGLTMRAGSALDGIEVLALNTLKRTSFTITEIILALNVCIFAIAAFKLGMETALYSVLTYFTASRTIDYVIEGIEAYTGVTIISGKSELIKYRLVNELSRGITVYKGERGFLPGKYEVSADCDIIFTVVTRLEMRRLKNLVYEADPHAFVFANTIREASGGILKRKNQH
ncbi:MAG: YitT family protein [Candidatus Dadabacteria bacterium]